MKSYEELNRISRNFRDVAGDLMRSDTDSFDTAINFFRSFCDDESVIQDILAPIKERTFDSWSWYNQALDSDQGMVGSGNATLPNNKLDALKAIYDILWNEEAGNVLLNFGHATMFKRNYDEQLRTVNDKLTNFFVRFIIRELEEKIELVKPQGNQNVQNWYINAPANIANNSSHFSQQIDNRKAELHEELTKLRTAITQSNISENEIEDALDTVDMIEEESAKEEPNKTRIQKFLTLLPSADTVVSIASNITNIVSQL